jgi:gas vesicle protein
MKRTSNQVLRNVMEVRDELMDKLKDLQLRKVDEVEKLFKELKELADEYNKIEG